MVVTPDYNHGPSGALKNAIDSLYHEWNNKAAGCVRYGGGGGAHVVVQLRLVIGELMVADIRAQVGPSLLFDCEARGLGTGIEHEPAFSVVIGVRGQQDVLRGTNSQY